MFQRAEMREGGLPLPPALKMFNFYDMKSLFIGDINRAINAPSEFIPTICNFCIFIDGSWDFYTSFCTSMF